jgi:hypothetical protein
VIVAVIAVDAARRVGPHGAARVLHLEEVAIAPLDLLQQRRQTRPGQVPLCAEIARDLKQADGGEHGCVHPLADVAGIVPAARHVDVLAGVAPHSVVQVAGGVHIRDGDAASLGMVIAQRDGQGAPPCVLANEERHRALSAGGRDEQSFPIERAEIAHHVISQVARHLLQRHGELKVL